MVTEVAVCCPRCFHNYGFVQTVTRHAKPSVGRCPSCASKSEIKLTEADLLRAMEEFFVAGSVLSEREAPVYQVNFHHENRAAFDATLQPDVDRCRSIVGASPLLHRMQLWRLGFTTHYYDFAEGGATRQTAVSKLIGLASVTSLTPKDRIYRIRLNMPEDGLGVIPESFDPPPPGTKSTLDRWDDEAFPVLYAADAVETCLHECRTTLADEITLAVLRPTLDLKILDLSADFPNDDVTFFDDPNVFVRFLSMKRDSEWTGFCRVIAREAITLGYDGIKYQSYYSQAKAGDIALNFAVFGRPLAEQRMRIESINRLRFKDMRYEFAFGPALRIDGN